VLTVQEAGAERWALSFEGESATNSLTLNSNSTSNIIHFAPDGKVGIVLRILIARSGNEGGGDNTNSNVSIIETTNSVIAETGSAGTMKSISFAAAFTSGTNSSSSSHGVEIQATTDIDTGSGCAIDFIGMIYGHETIEFS
jgi:hypothetical protein